MCVCGEKSQYIDVLVVVLLEQFSHFSDKKEQYTLIYKLVFVVRDYFMLLVFKEGGQGLIEHIIFFPGPVFTKGLRLSQVLGLNVVLKLRLLSQLSFVLNLYSQKRT